MPPPTTTTRAWVGSRSAEPRAVAGALAEEPGSASRAGRPGVPPVTCRAGRAEEPGERAAAGAGEADGLVSASRYRAARAWLGRSVMNMWPGLCVIMMA